MTATSIKFDNFAIKDIKTGQVDTVNKISKNDIAIIGMAGKYPQADDINEFWENLRHGVCSTGDFPWIRREKMRTWFDYLNLENDVEFMKCAYLDEVDQFDYRFFQLSPNEASLMDPHQRLFLETAWSAIEDAGYGGKKLSGSKTGIYVGFGGDNWYRRMISNIDPNLIPMALAGNLNAIVASRLAYLLNLRGPAYTIDSACSSSLLAVHCACQGIKSGDCEMAIAGSVKLIPLPVKSGVNHGIESPDGYTRTFDDSADGTGGGEGVAAILLKPLTRALEDGDSIYAVIKGSAVNQDGSSNGITAPNPEAQEELLIQAWENAKIDPETITYIEAHGTGTRLGDPVEVLAMQKAFGRYTKKRNFCAIGSLKSNLGHLDYAAGISGVVKTVLSLKNKELPPTLHFSKPNRNIDFSASSVYVNDSLLKWETAGFPRRAGVSAFGLSGTNCHLILEEAPGINRSCEKSATPQIFALSAKSEGALKELIRKFNKFLNDTLELNLEDICYTVNTGRGHYNHRLAMILKDEADLREKISLINGLEDLHTDGKEIFYDKYKIVTHIRAQNENAPLEDGMISQSELSGLENEASQVIREFNENTNNNLGLMQKISGLYVKGVEIAWDELYKGKKLCRVNLPTYPFERNSCSLDIFMPANTISPARCNNFFHIMEWKKSAALLKENASSKDGVVLIFTDDRGIGKTLGDSLELDGKRVIEVGFMKEYRKKDGTTVLFQGKQNDYQMVADELKDSLVQVIHLFTIAHDTKNLDLKETDTNLQKGIFSLLYLTKALYKTNFKGDIFLVSEYIDAVDRTEMRICPENAALMGMGRVIPQECPGVKCRFIDIDIHTTVKDVLEELSAASGVYLTAYRNGIRYEEVFEKAEFPASMEGASPVKDQGVYVITGGTGGIGLEIGKYLASKNKVILALINRSKMPERSDWDDIISHGEDHKLAAKLKKIREMELAGSQVYCYSADVANLAEMSNVVTDIRNKYGRINGVVHCAGLTAGVLISEKSDESFRKILAPKILGTLIIDQLTRVDDPDFFIMCSSVASFLGAPGSSDYAAANAFLDSFAAYRHKQGKRTLTINWPAWKETGMAVDLGKMDESIFKALTNGEAIYGLEKSLNCNRPRVIVGELNYTNQLFYYADQFGLRLSDEVKGSFEKRMGQSKKFKQVYDIALKGKVTYSGTEKRLAAIWSEVLGFKEVDVYDDFYQLGGDSITATILAVKVHKEFNVELTLHQIFNAPTIQSMAELVEKASRSLYESIAVVPEQEYYPVSSAQKRMYILNQMAREETNYNLSVAVMMEGTIDRIQFEKAVVDLIQRHESLRTTFEMIDGASVQKIHQVVEFKVEYFEAGITGDEEDARGHKIYEDIIQRFIRPFDLKMAPLLRVGLIACKRVALEEPRHILVYDMHHIISDGVTMDILVREFARLYNGEQLPGLRIQYKEFSMWQNRRLQLEVMKKQETYWLDQFTGEIPVLNLPTDYPRPAVLSHAGEIIWFGVNPDLAAGLKKISYDTGATLFMVLLATYYVLLYRYTGQDDLVVGTPIAGRLHNDLENVVGMFVNTLALRNRPCGEKSFAAFLKEVKENALSSFENQDYNFEALINKLQIPRKTNRNPLFDVLFVLQNIRSAEIEIADLKLKPFEFKHTVVQFDLTLEATEKAGGLWLGLKYNTVLFKTETAVRIIDDYLKILGAVVSDMNIKIKEIDLGNNYQRDESALDTIEFDF